ncbi:MAG: RloB family protein [Imperialibacter sp.]
MSKRKPPQGKKINPQFWVFCEGETEEAYVEHLRGKYRIPISIVPKVAGSSISEAFIKKSKRGKPVDPKDRDFLMYDADVPELMNKLRAVPNTTLFLSNPCIELWFLLHYKGQQAALTASDCIRELSNRNHNSYRKGFIDQKLRTKLVENCKTACERAKKLPEARNPSSNIYSFIEILEVQKSEK